MATIMPAHEPAQPLVGRAESAEERKGSDASGSTVTVPRIRPRDPVAKAVLVSLRSALSRIRGTEGEARRGDVEGIHRLRTATRRLRSELRAFRSLVDADWIGPLEDELKWLAGLLGNVRDLDVLAERFRKAVGEEDFSGTGALAPLFTDLMARHVRASRELRVALQGERYRGLLASLQRAIDQPPPEADACAACRTALPPLAAAAWRRLKKHARALRRLDPDEAFHEVRKLAKRARYTAEMVAPVLSGAAAKGARRFIRGATRVQDILGEHQDAIVAGQELASIIGRHSDGPWFASAANRLLEGQAEAARRAREAFFDVWDKLDRKKSRRWLKASAR
jgi:CHAD domain-containing protein